MGDITSVLIRYDRIGKYHHSYVLFFCKDMDKTMKSDVILLNISVF